MREVVPVGTPAVCRFSVVTDNRTGNCKKHLQSEKKRDTINTRRAAERKPCRIPLDGLVAQLGERCVRNAEVMGSIPTRSTSPVGRAAEIGGSPGFGVFSSHEGEARLDLRDSIRLCLLPVIGGRTAEIEIRHTMGRFGYHRSIPEKAGQPKSGEVPVSAFFILQ